MDEFPGPLDPNTPTGGPEAATDGRAAHTPEVFGRYRVSRSLGSGGFGDVYLGHDTQLDRAVAIKVLRGAAAAPAGGNPSLEEARKLAQLRHPGIVAVYDVGVRDGRMYIVSEYLDGPDLGRWLRTNRPHWTEAARIAAAVAGALAQAHARLIVHRDVKPANIILTADGAPVLVDFGLALGDEQSGGAAKGRVSGTPWYMSPEQVKGKAHRIDGRTDIYSLGIVLYELLTGRVPFRAASMPELMRQVTDDEPQPPRQLVQDVPPELERACLKALAKRQEDRYVTAGDFADDLRRILQNSPRPSATFTPVAPVAANIRTPSAPTASAYRATTTRGASRGAERRQLTVLVCGSDEFESATYLELDAEDQARVLRTFQDACAEIVVDLGGTLVQATEKGVVACFGFPVAYEDAAGRAARAGLAILERIGVQVDERSSAAAEPPRPWAAIHTGPAIAESTEGVVSLVGEARNIAVRLEDAATAGVLICTESSYRLFQGQFESTALGPRTLRGFPHAIELFRVERVGDAASSLAAQEPAALSPLTGRDQELALLMDRWEQAREGTGQLVLLVAEPGFGKSRLVHAMKQRILGQSVEGQVDAPVVEWRCSPHFQNTGLHPAIDFYERALRVEREEPADTRFERMVQRLEQYGLARPAAVPLWAALLSLPMPDRFPAQVVLPTRQREDTFHAMLEWLHTRAARQPFMFVVEDLHWMDASTTEFLGLFLAEAVQHPILTVLTFRPEFTPPWPAPAHQTSLSLNRLTRRQVGDLMRARAGSGVSDDIVDQVFERTGGVPLFVEEFTKVVQESGVLDDQRRDSARSRALLGRDIPPTLQDLMMARLDRMGGLPDVVQLAATLGREFTYELLAAVADVDEPTLRSELSRLVQAEILYSKGRPPRSSYVFKHALLEDAAYNSLVKARRQQFHQRIAGVLEARFPQTVETQPELLARHVTEAGLADKAVRYWLSAGMRARNRSENLEAIAHLSKGLDLLATLEPSPDRDARELELLNLVGAAYQSARGFAAVEAADAFDRARRLTERTGRPEQLFATLWGNWAFHVVRADLADCETLADELVEVAARLNDPGTMMEATCAHGFTRYHRGEFAGAHQDCVKALSEFDDLERTKAWAALTSHNSSITTRCLVAMSLWHLGHPDQAQRSMNEMLALAREIGQPFGLCVALHHVGWLCAEMRLATKARAAGAEMIELADRHGFVMWAATGKGFAAAGLSEAGQSADAARLLQEGLATYRGIGARLSMPLYLSVLASIHLRLGQFAAAREAIDDALDVIAITDERQQESELHRQLGETHLGSTNDEAAAERCFRTAIEIAQRQGSRAWELRATTSLARLWMRQGRRALAGQTLRAVYSTFTEGFDSRDLVDAGEILKSAPQPAARLEPGPSPQE